MTNRDCKHGRLARSCDVCELESQRDEAEDAADRIGRSLVASEQRVVDLEAALREIASAARCVHPRVAVGAVHKIARKALGADDDDS